MTMEEMTEMIEKIREYAEENRYSRIKEELSEMNAADVAGILEELPPEMLLKIFRILPKGAAADVFSYLSIDVEQEIVEAISVKETAALLDNLYADDATDLLEEMPASVVHRILAAAKPETRRDINHLLQYKEDSAGSIMTVELVDLKEEMTVREAMGKIRRDGIDKETINTCYVVDKDRTLLGTVSLRRLLLSDEDTTMSEIMHEQVVFVHTSDDQEEVASQFKKYDLTSMPVVDSEERLVGIITVDDIVDIMEQEATEDIEKMAAILPSDKPYLKTGVFETWKKRIPWLLLLMISATFTGSIIQHYEEALGTFVILTAFIPMLMDTGGNAGGQASVTIIRGLSLNEIEFRDILRVLWKEIRVAAICGFTLAAANFVKLMVFDLRGEPNSLLIAAVVCMTLALAVLVAKIVGCTLPIFAKKIGFDPAVMASPFITTIVDAISLMIYFSVATALLHL